jgi:hypothetical protein
MAVGQLSDVTNDPYSDDPIVLIDREFGDERRNEQLTKSKLRG